MKRFLTTTLGVALLFIMEMGTAAGSVLLHRKLDESSGGSSSALAASPTIADIVRDDSDLSILLELVTIADLVEELSGPGPLTVFAPTNAAFEEVIVDVNNLEVLDIDIVTDLVKYHVAPGEILAGDISDGLLLPTLEGDSVEFIMEDDGVVTVDEQGFVATDISASNGVIHKIDGVLFPASFFQTAAPSSAAAVPASTLVAAATFAVTLVASM